MQFFLLFLFLSLCVFLFVLYWIGKDDLVLLRRNIALEQLFNIAGLSLGIGLFTSRLTFVLLHPARVYLNPLVFLAFPYFPGLSLLGGIAGGLGFLFYFTWNKKLPLGRLLDFFSLALLSAFPLGIIGKMFISRHEELIVLFILILIYIFATAVFFSYLYPKLLHNNLKEGMIATSCIILFSIVQIGSNMFLKKNELWFFMGIEEFGFLLLLLVGISVVIKMQVITKKHLPK